jgi:hypothetical protein
MRSIGSALLLAFLMSGCAAPRPTPEPAPDYSGIRNGIAAIRQAIMDRDAAGIVARATPDWSFTGADGVTYDREGFITRTKALFDRTIALESLTTDIDSITPRDGFAEVEITQTLTRRERTTEGGEQRVRVRYRERQEWVEATDGWRVRKVNFLGAPERTILPND